MCVKPVATGAVCGARLGGANTIGKLVKNQLCFSLPAPALHVYTACKRFVKLHLSACWQCLDISVAALLLAKQDNGLA